MSFEPREEAILYTIRGLLAEVAETKLQPIEIIHSFRTFKTPAVDGVRVTFDLMHPTNQILILAR